jgi:hypothetical protein
MAMHGQCCIGQHHRFLNLNVAVLKLWNTLGCHDSLLSHVGCALFIRVRFVCPGFIPRFYPHDATRHPVKPRSVCNCQKFLE